MAMMKFYDLLLFYCDAFIAPIVQSDSLYYREILTFNVSFDTQRINWNRPIH